MKSQRVHVGNPHITRPEAVMVSRVRHVPHSWASGSWEPEEIAGPRELPERRVTSPRLLQWPIPLLRRIARRRWSRWFLPPDASRPSVGLCLRHSCPQQTRPRAAAAQCSGLFGLLRPCIAPIASQLSPTCLIGATRSESVSLPRRASSIRTRWRWRRPTAT